ncbi:hypothetical protein [Actinoplanes subtropicus]|uniref:hypothetical protein n=1 Tax=Actinoplanes subtropicus TaxID=543632 RepID=UPI0004C2F9D1|nr:hypothetical protein [Actinoplanes subtropicus]
MSHYGLFLCLPPWAGKNWREAADLAMEPFRIDDETGRGECDYWHSSGGFWVRPECVDDPLIVPSSTEWPGDPLRCDGGPKRTLDLAGMRSAAVATGREVWAAWQDAVRRHPPALPFDRLRPRYSDPAAAWDAFQAQPLVREFDARHADEATCSTPCGPTPPRTWSRGSVTTRSASSIARAEWAVTTYAFISTDGRWFDAETTPGYRSLLRTYLDDLPDEAFLIALDCHS